MLRESWPLTRRIIDSPARISGSIDSVNCTGFECENDGMRQSFESTCFDILKTENFLHFLLLRTEFVGFTLTNVSDTG